VNGNVQDVLARLQKVKTTPNGWGACCPAHGDRHASLSIGTGEDGRILLFCHAGCKPEAVVAALGLKLADLFPPSPHAAGPRRTSPGEGPCPKYTRPTKPPASPKAEAEPPRNLDAEAAFARDCRDDLSADEDALAYLWHRRGIGCKTASDWGVGVTDIRRDSAGAIIGATWTLPIVSHVSPRPLIGVKVHRDPPPAGKKKGGWLVGGGAALFPLPESQRLQAGAEIVLCEGELKALAYLEAGIPATSPTTGAAMRWTPDMAGRFDSLAVVIDPDREDSQAAEGFVRNAARALSGVAASVETTQ
jgi:hypothetical protein